MRQIYTSIINSPDWNDQAYQMIQSGFSPIAVKGIMYDEVAAEWRNEYTDSEIERGIAAIQTVVERNI